MGLHWPPGPADVMEGVVLDAAAALGKAESAFRPPLAHCYCQEVGLGLVFPTPGPFN